MKKWLQNVNSSVSKFAGRTGLKIQKYSPEILMVIGGVGFVGTVILACKETLKADQVLDEHARLMEKIEESKEMAAELQEEYDEKKNKTIVYAKTAAGFAKLYAPAVAVGTLSLACILTSNNIMKKRYLGAVAAYNAVSGAFETYRSRVREELGDEKDQQFRYGIKKETIETEVVDDKGKTKIKKEKVEVIDGMPSQYAVYFEEFRPDGGKNYNWDENPEFTLMFLRAQLKIANDILHSKGHLFLNEVYEMLGFPDTQAGAVVGWVDNGEDGYVDFGLYDPNNESARRFINGKDNVVLLDFNVDGVILDLI